MTRVDQMWSGGCGAWVVGWIMAILAPGFSRLPKFPKKGDFRFSKFKQNLFPNRPQGALGAVRLRQIPGVR